MINKAKGLISHPLFSGSFLMIGGGMAINAVNYLYHLLMGRLLGPVDYGSLASIFSILYVISIVPISTSFAIVKFISSAKNRAEKAATYRSIKRLLWYIAGGGFLVLVLFSPIISNFLHIEERLGVFLVAPILFLSLITLVNQASMQGELKFIGVVGPSSASSIGKFILGLLFVYLGFSVSGAVLGVLLSMILAYWLSVKLIGSDFSFKTNRKFKLKPFLKYAFPVLMQALAFTLLFTVDVILVKHFLPPFEAGLYAALSTLGKIIYFAAQPVTAVMFPIVSGRKAKGEYYRTVFFISLFLTVFISISIVLFYWLFPGIAIGLLYGRDYLLASRELVWMGVFMAVYTASYLLVNFLLSINHTKIVILPLLASLAQVIGILFLHKSILQVIQVSLSIMGVLFFGLVVYLSYFEVKRIYVKTKA
jgi:O-antigen/teichoic acid export membrane protein